jgi:hypothetical protein
MAGHHRYGGPTLRVLGVGINPCATGTVCGWRYTGGSMSIQYSPFTLDLANAATWLCQAAIAGMPISSSTMAGMKIG